jgi:hypothetical protein
MATTVSPIEILKQRYGDDFSGIRLKDKLLLAANLLVGLYGFQKRDLRSIHTAFIFWGDDFENPGLETLLDTFDSKSVFDWFLCLETLLPQVKTDFHQLAQNMQRLQQSGLDVDLAESVGLLLLDAKAGAYQPDEMALMDQAIARIEANGDPLKILANQENHAKS